MSQKSFCAVNAHDLVCAGASPKYSATWALTFGEVIQSIHLYMQLGWAAFAATIQVSDQPVDPSFGSTVLTWTLFSVPMVLAMTCHVVPITEVPDSKPCTSFV